MTPTPPLSTAVADLDLRTGFDETIRAIWPGMSQPMIDLYWDKAQGDIWRAALARSAAPARELAGYFAFHDGEWHASNVDDPCSVKLYRYAAPASDIAAAPEQQPVAWMRANRKECTTAESKMWMENAGFGHWPTIAKDYTIPLYDKQQDHVAPPFAAPASRVQFDEATIEAAALKHVATDWHLISHLIPNYRCTEQFTRLKAFAEELASGFREGRNAQDDSVAAPGSATAGAAAMSKAEAAQWCRENGLNVPAEWERAAEVSPPDALSPVAQDGAMPKQSVTPWTVRMGVSVDDMVCPQEAWHHLKAEILGWRALFAARLAADVSPPDGAMPEPLGYITKESMRHLQEGGSVMAAIHPEVEPGATDFQPIYAAQPAEGSAQVAMPRELVQRVYDRLCKAQIFPLAGEVSKVMDAIPEVAAPERGDTPAPDTCAEMRALCSACGGTGEVHDLTGEWRGSCDCAASKALDAAPAGMTDALDAARYRWLRNQNIFDQIGSFAPYVVQGQTMIMLDGADLDKEVDRARIDGDKQGAQGTN